MYKMDQKFMQLYADFIVKVGVNVQPRQNFIVRCPVTMPEFAPACARAGYAAGAKRVVVRWEDERLSRIDMELAAEEDLKAMKPYELRSWLDFAEDPDGCCTLAIHAADPEAYAGLDAGKLNRVMIIGKGSLFLGRMTNLFDGVSFVIQANTGAEETSGGVSEAEVKGMIAKAMRDFAATLMDQAE